MPGCGSSRLRSTTACRQTRLWLRGPGLRHSVQCFCLTSQSLSSVETARRFLDNLDAITKACEEEPGPFIFAVHSQRIERLRLDDA
jgi:hypothetical protein